MKRILILVVGFVCKIGVAGTAVDTKDIFKYKFYAGGVGGSGYTTWSGLVPLVENQNNAMSLSTPIQVDEGGGVWGVFAGYEITPFFAIEANYMSFPDAFITFDEDSLFAFEQNGMTVLKSKTRTASAMAKIMLIIPKTSLRIFSGAGVASVWRTDAINRSHRISPTFSFGANLNVNERVMVELGTNYTAGYGESEINPANDYIPFVYSFFAKLALRFNV